MSRRLAELTAANELDVLAFVVSSDVRRGLLALLRDCRPLLGPAASQAVAVALDLAPTVGA